VFKLLFPSELVLHVYTVPVSNKHTISVCLSDFLCLSVCLSLSIYLSVRPSVCLSVCIQQDKQVFFFFSSNKLFTFYPLDFNIWITNIAYVINYSIKMIHGVNHLQKPFAVLLIMSKYKTKLFIECSSLVKRKILRYQI